MPNLPPSTFHDSWTVKGAGSPIASNISGGRALTLAGSGTAPKGTSLRGRRGALFRSSSFSATSPRAFATPAPGTYSAALYVSSKIQSFTLSGWFRPSKTGVSAIALTPVGGLFSATNMGATPWIFNQPCLLFTPGNAGDTALVVSLFGSILDTRVATQTSGPATTTPIEDGNHNFVSVRVTADPSTNNTITSVSVLIMSESGVARIYTLGEHKPACLLNFGAANPSDGQTITIDGRAYTMRTALAGTPAVGGATYSSGNATDGQTIVVGEDSDGNPITYTFRDYVGTGEAATAVIEFNTPVTYSGSTPKTQIQAGGWTMTCLWGTKYPDQAAAGGLGFGATSTDISSAAAAKVFEAWHGDWDNLRDFQIPSTPATGSYDAGKSWANRRILPGTSTALLDAASEAPVAKTIPLRALDVGAGGNAVAIKVLEQTAATGAYDQLCTPCRTGRNSPYIFRLRAPTTDVITTALGAAGNIANGTYKYSFTFVHASGESVEGNPTTQVMSGGPKKIELSTIPLGPSGTTARKVYRTKAGGSVYFLLATISDNTTTTYSDNIADGSLPTTTLPTTLYMSGGVSAAAARSVKIGGSYATTLSNLINAINATGTPGTTYSSDITTANPTATASSSGNDLVLTSKHAGSAGNGKPLSTTCTAFSSVTAFAGGVDGATTDEILIGATPSITYQNFVDALNLTGSAGIQYGDPTTINARVTAALVGSSIRLRSKESGTAGNGRTIATTCTGVTISDEFGDKTITSLTGGQAAPPFVVPSGARPDQTDLRMVWGGWVGTAPATTAGIFYGAVSDLYLANRVLTDEESLTLAQTPPPVSTRDIAWYRAPHKVRFSAKSERQSDFPVPRALATGSFGQKLELSVQGVRHSLELVSVEAGRPWAVSQIAMEVEVIDGLRRGMRHIVQFPGFRGLNNAPPPSKVPLTKAYDLLNLTFQGGEARSRRGYDIINNASTTLAALPGAYYDATNEAGDTYHLVFLAGSIYQIDNGELILLDSGFAQNELPTVATVGLKTFIMSRARSVIFQEGSILTTIGVTAPTLGPIYKSATPNVTNGVVALTPGYEYVYTYYDGGRATESGPSPATRVVLPTGSSPSGIVLSLGVSASTTVTARIVYRRKVGTATYYKVGELSNNTADEFTDSAETPQGEVLETFDGQAVEAAMPEGVSRCAAHEGRLVVWNPDRREVYFSELGDGERFYPFSAVVAQGSMRAAVSIEGRLVLGTDQTIEVVEGDLEQGSSGDFAVSRRVIDKAKGVFGPFAMCAARGGVFWVDENGLHTIGRGWDQQDVTDTLSDEVQPIIQQAVDTAGTNVVMAFNSFSQELCILLSKANPSATGTQDVKNRRMLVLNYARRSFGVYDHALSWIASVREGSLGNRFVGVDYYGNVLDLDVYDADGVQGNESWIPATHNITALSATAKTITKSGASFPTDGSMRGVSVVLEDVSAGTFHRVTILSNTADTVALSDLPSALEVGDLFYIGGIYSKLVTAEVEQGGAGVKVVRHVEMTFVDATQGRL